ncbi:MAG: MFS transporter [Pseudomonadota bacterium]
MNITKARAVSLICLIAAGEMIFSLPFHITRYFRPTFLATFGLTNATLGDIFAGYGLVAMAAYFPGGLLADRLPARLLITLSLIATGVGGLYLLTFPSANGLRFLFAYWGLTTILLFWAALLRATREWGGLQQQGLAYGLLDGGRGLMAALAASIAVFLFALIAGDQGADLTPAQRVDGMRAVIMCYTALTFLTALFCWLFVEKPSAPPEINDEPSPRLTAILTNQSIWLQAVIVLTAYCAYKGLDNYGLYLVDVLGVDELKASQFMAATAYLRPLGAIAAGLLADRFRASTVIVVLFALLTAIYLFAATNDLGSVGFNLLLVNLGVSFLAVFALRGVYFALLNEMSIATKMTGTAIGVVSVVGFAPDVFFYSITGRILDHFPGAQGHHYYFLLLAAIGLIGFTASLFLFRRVKLQNAAPQKF